MTTKLERSFQQIAAITSEFSIQKSALLGAAKMLRRTFSPQASGKGPEIENDPYHFTSAERAKIFFIIYPYDIYITFFN